MSEEKVHQKNTWAEEPATGPCQIPELWLRQLLFKFSWVHGLKESRTRGPCGVKGDGLQQSLSQFKSDTVIWGGSFPFCSPLQIDESLFGDRTALCQCWWSYLGCICYNAKSNPWHCCCIPCTEHTAWLMLLPQHLGGLTGFTQVSRHNFLWE